MNNLKVQVDPIDLRILKPRESAEAGEISGTSPDQVSKNEPDYFFVPTLVVG
jgi:hypothetical protein